MSAFMNERQASAYLRERWGIKAAPRTLANWRWLGSGSLYHKTRSRAVTYARNALDTFALSFIGEPRESTSAPF